MRTAAAESDDWLERAGPLEFHRGADCITHRQARQRSPLAIERRV